VKSVYFLLEESKGSCARALEKIYAKVHKKDGTCNIILKKIYVSSDKNVKFEPNSGKTVAWGSKSTGLFRIHAKIFYTSHPFRISEVFELSFSSLGLSPSFQYSFCRFEEREKPRLVSAKKATR
jgi:hypothetical protein